MRRVLLHLSAVLVVLAMGVGAAGCSSDDSDDEASSEDSTSGGATTDDSAAGGDLDEEETAAGICGDETVRILLSNDDGYTEGGFAVLARTLEQTPGIELTISAPLENQSGTSDSTTEGAAPATEAVTVGGIEATAVDGFPADSVIAGLGGEGDANFDLVVSGINKGQNIGEVEQLSGTVGAARTAARLGVPGLAVSQGLSGEAVPDYQTGVAFAIEWIGASCDEIFADPDGADEAAILYNLNVPTCLQGEVQGLLELDEGSIPLEGRQTSLGDCTATGQPTDEVDAFIKGYAPVVPLPAN